MRNVQKDIERAKQIIIPNRGLTVTELNELVSDDLFTAIRNAFMFGFAVGYRQATKRTPKAKP